jgi:hypothetical protein
LIQFASGAFAVLLGVTRAVIARERLRNPDWWSDSGKRWLDDPHREDAQRYARRARREPDRRLVVYLSYGEIVVSGLFAVAGIILCLRGI